MDYRLQTVEIPSHFSERDHLCDNTLIVVIDVMFFTTTTSILFENGVEKVHPIADENLFEEFEDIPCGGDNTNEQTVFMNRPQSVYGLATQFESYPTAVALESDNGAVAVDRMHTLRQNSEYEGVDIILGSLRNAYQVADYIRNNTDQYNSVLFYCAGSNGNVALEDNICQTVIKAELSNRHIIPEGYSTITKQLPLQQINSTPSQYTFADEDKDHASRIDVTDIIPIVTTDGVIVREVNYK